MNMNHRMGPSIVPWGTPSLQLTTSERTCCRFELMNFVSILQVITNSELSLVVVCLDRSICLAGVGGASYPILY